MIYFENEFINAKKKAAKYNTRLEIIYNFLISKLTDKIRDELLYQAIEYNKTVFFCEFIKVAYVGKYMRIHLTFFAHNNIRKLDKIRIENSRDRIKKHSYSFPQNSKYAKTIWLELFICDKMFEMDFKELIKNNFKKYCEDLDLIYKI